MKIVQKQHRQKKTSERAKNCAEFMNPGAIVFILQMCIKGIGGLRRGRASYLCYFETTHQTTIRMLSNPCIDRGELYKDNH